MPTLLRPKSRGSIRLRSGDPFESPIIDPNYLEHPDDVKTFVAGMKVGLKLAQAESIKKRKLSVMIDKHHCGNTEPFSDGYIECVIRHWATTVYHPVGTCKMGPGSDPAAVVDARLRVRGVGKLRVIDASIMPTIVSGNTNAAAVLIGEKGVAMVIEDYASGQSKPSTAAQKDEL